VEDENRDLARRQPREIAGDERRIAPEQRLPFMAQIIQAAQHATLPSVSSDSNTTL